MNERPPPPPSQPAPIGDESTKGASGKTDQLCHQRQRQYRKKEDLIRACLTGSSDTKVLEEFLLEHETLLIGLSLQGKESDPQGLIRLLQCCLRLLTAEQNI